MTVPNTPKMIPITPEVAARLTLARSVTADFARAAAGFDTPDWLSWSNRLAASLGGLLEALGAADAPESGREAFQAAAVASSGRAPDGTGRLSAQDTLTVIAALSDAAEYRSAHSDDGDRQLIVAYRLLSLGLGDDR